MKYNGNLLIHGCIPLDQEGNMEKMTIENQPMQDVTYLIFLNIIYDMLLHILKKQMIWQQIWFGIYGQENILRCLVNEK